MLATCLQNVRDSAPLVHCITNAVTVNDCANILLACGASPIMADDAGEAEEITSICGGLCLNIGTLSARTIPAMLLAGKKARALGRPAVLDPVGAGASALRTQTGLQLLREAAPAVVRGNISEIRALAEGGTATRGVDAAAPDAVTEQNLRDAVAFVQGFARKTGAVVAVTGAIDIVASADRAFVIRNGHPILSRITGSGCMLSALAAAFAAANPGKLPEATAAAVCLMGLCGERAQRALLPGEGTGAFRSRLIDAVSLLDGGALERGAKIEVVQ